MEATESADLLFDLGCELQRAERYQEALSALEQAQAIDPNIPYIKHKIALSHLRLRNYTTALALYEAQVQETPNDLDAWVGLSISAFECRQWEKSLAKAEQAFKLNPNNALILHCYSIILREFGHFKRALHLLERSVLLDPENAEARVQLGLRQLEEGDYKNGWKTFEARWRWRHYQGKPWVNSQVPRWAGESLAQKNIFLWYEPWQGIGDEILFLRYAAPLAERAQREGGLIMLACHEPLLTLFGRSLADHRNVLFLTTKERGQAWQPQHFLGRTPMQCPIMSLPLFLSEIPPRFPYLTPDPVKVEAWRERLSVDKSVKVGLSWTGREDHPRNDLRTVPILDLVRAIKNIPGVTLYSLQREHPDQARAAALIDFTQELASVDDTAALVSNLDLVIGVDSMTAHLAGALNIPTWVLCDFNPPWMWGRKDKRTIWYPSVNVYRQHKMHRWEGVFEEIRADLRATQAARH